MHICIYNGQEASWKRGFDPVYPHCIDLYHELGTKVFSDLTRLSEPGSISAGFWGTDSTPAGFQEEYIYIYIRVYIYI